METVSCGSDKTFCFMKEVSMQGMGWFNLRDTSKLDEPLYSSLPGSTCRTSYLLGQGTWEGWAVTGEIRLLHQEGICCHCLLCLDSSYSSRRTEDREYSVSCTLSVGPAKGKVGCDSSIEMIGSRE